jgi:hypothetical protein
MPFSAEAAARSSFLTNSGSNARQVGVAMASPAESANVSASSNHGDMKPAIVAIASALAIPTIQ